MKDFYDTVFNQLTSRPLIGAQVRVLNNADKSLATIYQSDGGAEIENPIPVADENASAPGFFRFWAGPGFYDIQYLYGGQVIKTIEKVDLGTDVTHSELNDSAGAALVGISGGGTVQDHIDELAGASGGDLVGWKRSGSSAGILLGEALEQRPVTPDEMGADATGVADSAAAIQAAMDFYGSPSPSSPLDDAGKGRVVFRPRGLYRVKSSITIPFGIDIDLSRCRIEPHPDASLSDFYPYDGSVGYLFLLNCDSAGNQVMASGGNTFPTIRNGLFNNRDSDGNPILANLKVFYTKGHHSFDNIEAVGFYGIISKPAESDNYTDGITIRKVYARSSKGSDWLIDIGYLGDGLKVEGCRSSVTNTENMNLLRVSRNRGGRVECSINGNHLFEQCRGISFDGFHIESGYVESRGSSMEWSNGVVHRQESANPVLDPITGTTLGFACPLRIFRSANDRPAGPHTIRNVGIAMSDEGGMSASYIDADAPDLVLEGGAACTIQNFHRHWEATTAGFGNYSAAKITRYASGSTDAGAPAANWENVSSLAAKGSVYSGNVIDLATRSTTIPASYSFTSLATSSSATFLGDTGTYYYRIVILHGPRDRKVARLIAEQSVAVTNGGNAPLFTFSENAIARTGYVNATIHIERGTAAATYTKVAELPLVNGLKFIDRGFYLSTGERWISRSSGDIGSYNTSSTFTRIEAPNATNCILYGTTTLPTTGTWVAGDRFIGDFEARYDGSAWVIVGGPASTNSDIGNANYTAPLANGGLIIANTAITADRTVTMPAANKAAAWRVVRTSAATGAFNVLVKDAGGSTLATLSTTGSVTLAPTGSGWVVNS